MTKTRQALKINKKTKHVNLPALMTAEFAGDE